MKRILSYEINEDYAGLSIQEFLKQQGYSTKVITYVKRTDMGLCIHGERVRTNHILRLGEVLKVSIVEEVGSINIVPTNIPIQIVYEDEDILIINKAADVPIHPSQGNFDNTLANMVAYYFEAQGEKVVFRCINRLDRDTTGLLILAKNMLSGCILSDMMVKREIQREYHAIVSGHIVESGTIDAPIAREVASTILRCVDFENGERAVTHFNRLKITNECSYVALKLETGRTHQIRVHMQYMGHTLLGDSLYGGDKDRIGRQALHSYRLQFKHPITKEILDFIAPIPVDMRKIIE
ncbi:RluA family pseudouridine synthase [Anaeromicropila herbilytica]|uniref:Pseudouridine synthase n=1 Tax=Anaeromicropila herbilytica TaxID=2785025 RepID=A0A7R7EP33_9FIRM|nr:RluA family pseudouridine synthase [Anaeromicropila herbilytica]BCN32485.1 pseudouridine synthase [Anaeromicropila herbilytica]